MTTTANQLAAARIPGRSTVHIAETGSFGQFVPACPAGSRKVRTVARGRVSFVTATVAAVPTPDAVTCGNCLHAHADLIAAWEKATRWQYEDAAGLATHGRNLERAVSELAWHFTTHRDFPGTEGWKCEEVDALAYVFLAAGQRELAQMVIVEHVAIDEPGDVHHLPTSIGDRVAAWAAEYCDVLLSSASPSLHPATNARDELLFTVELDRTDDTATRGNGATYALYAGTPQQAQARALWFHTAEDLIAEPDAWKAVAVAGRPMTHLGWCDLRNVTDWPAGLSTTV